MSSLIEVGPVILEKKELKMLKIYNEAFGSGELNTQKFL